MRYGWALLLLAGCGPAAEESGEWPAAVPPPLPLIDAGSKLKRTSIVPVLQTPHAAGQNLIWCSTFELAWQEFIGQGPASGEPAYVTHLNAKTATKADLDPSWYVARAGTV